MQSYFSRRDLRNQLDDFGYLVELHTHLFGMGDFQFWVKNVLLKDDILPSNSQYRIDQMRRRRLGPLVWNNELGTFFDAKTVEEAFSQLKDLDVNDFEVGALSIIGTTFPPSRCPSLSEDANFKLFAEMRHRKLNFKEHFSYDVILSIEDLGKALGIIVTSPEESRIELDQLQHTIEERLGVFAYQRPNFHREVDEIGMTGFKHWIVWNARNQDFRIVYGLTVESIRELVGHCEHDLDPAKRDAYGHLVNAFSMQNPDGTEPKSIDFHSFRGAFTPEFYPRRFALKDSIIGQRLDILALLLLNELNRYSQCKPPVQYVEFSVSSGDLAKPWVFEVLTSFECRLQVRQPTHNSYRGSVIVPKVNQATNSDSSYSNQQETEQTPNRFALLVNDTSCNGLRFPYLNSFYFCQNGIYCEYRFLAGFKRESVRLPSPFDSASNNHAAKLLYEAPALAIHWMSKEISRSKEILDEISNSGNSSMPGSLLFSAQESALEKLMNAHALDRSSLSSHNLKANRFFKFVVGIDLVGDEFGYPYCPFVSAKFIDFVRRARSYCDQKFAKELVKVPLSDVRSVGISTRNKFGVRIHCGEYVPDICSKYPGYRYSISHMYIVVRALQYVKEQLERSGTNSLRIGHGIAFASVLQQKPEFDRKSNVLLAELQILVIPLLRTMVLEINQTSNYYLTSAQQSSSDLNSHNHFQSPAEVLLSKTIPVILSTDDEGIWPISCSTLSGNSHAGLDIGVLHEHGHHSLASEYCRFISISTPSLWRASVVPQVTHGINISMVLPTVATVGPAAGDISITRMLIDAVKFSFVERSIAAPSDSTDTPIISPPIPYEAVVENTSQNEQEILVSAANLEQPMPEIANTFLTVQMVADPHLVAYLFKNWDRTTKNSFYNFYARIYEGCENQLDQLNFSAPESPHTNLNPEQLLGNVGIDVGDDSDEDNDAKPLNNFDPPESPKSFHEPVLNERYMKAGCVILCSVFHIVRNQSILNVDLQRAVKTSLQPFGFLESEFPFDYVCNLCLNVMKSLAFRPQDDCASITLSFLQQSLRDFGGQVKKLAIISHAPVNANRFTEQFPVHILFPPTMSDENDQNSSTTMSNKNGQNASTPASDHNNKKLVCFFTRMSNENVSEIESLVQSSEDITCSVFSSTQQQTFRQILRQIHERMVINPNYNRLYTSSGSLAPIKSLFGDHPSQNLFYVISPHGSATTAAFRQILSAVVHYYDVELFSPPGQGPGPDQIFNDDIRYEKKSTLRALILDTPLWKPKFKEQTSLQSNVPLGWTVLVQFIVEHIRKVNQLPVEFALLSENQIKRAVATTIYKDATSTLLDDKSPKLVAVGNMIAICTKSLSLELSPFSSEKSELNCDLTMAVHLFSSMLISRLPSAVHGPFSWRKCLYLALTIKENLPDFGVVTSNVLGLFRQLQTFSDRKRFLITAMIGLSLLPSDGTVDLRT